jgi:hypothetical protein
MILFKETEVALLTPPKNASSTLYEVLCTPAVGGVEVLGPMPGPQPLDIESHSTVIPRRFKHFKIVIAARNPISRAKSLWRHELQHGDGRAKNLRFDEWVRDRLIETYTWWHWPTSKFSHCFHDFIKVETFAADLDRLFGVKFDGELHNVSEPAEPPSAELEAAIPLIHYWAELDFKLFGYSFAGERSPASILT